MANLARPRKVRNRHRGGPQYCPVRACGPIHPLIAAGIRRTDKELRAAEIARPMRELFRQLKTGEVFEVEGRAVMHMPEVDPLFYVPGTEWVDVPHGLISWAGSIGRLAPSLRTDKMCYLAERLAQDKGCTKRMVEQASEQFEAFVARIPRLPEGVLRSDALTCQIALEFEKIKETA